MKIFGHPLHVILIHFPAALFPMDFVCALLFYFTTKSSFTDASYYAMAGGVALGWVAVITGTYDLIGVQKTNPSALNTALLHGGINLVVVIVYSVLFYRQYKLYPAVQPDSVALLIVKLV